MRISKRAKRYVKSSKDTNKRRRIVASTGCTPGLYIEDNAGGYTLLATDGSGWFYYNDAPSGEFLGVDLHQDDPDVTASQIIKALNSGDWDFTSVSDVIEDAQTSGDWTPIPQWRGMTIDDIDSEVNYSSDGTPIGHDTTSWTEVTASTKIRPITAGAGSAITLEIRSLDFTSAPNSGFYVLDRQEGILEPEDQWCKGELDIASIGTYYDGGDPRVGDIPVTIRVYEVVFDDSDDLNSGEFKDLTVNKLVNDITELEDNKVKIGGGWLKSKFPGMFKCIAYTDYATIDLRVTIDDKELAEWLDAFAHGDNEVVEFDVCINDDPIGNPTESQEDAIATAEKYAADPQYADDEITVIMIHYMFGYDGDILDYYDDDGDVVWSSMDDMYS